MNPMDNVVGRLNEISARIAQIQAQSKLPPSLRDSASGSSAAADAAAPNALRPAGTLESSEVDRFQTLLDQALSLNDADAVSGAVSGALSRDASTDDLQRYQEMLLDAIREASRLNDEGV